MSINSESASTLPLIDSKSLLERCMGNFDLVNRLNSAFLSSLPIEKSALQHAVASKDLNAIVRISHKLRGTASNMCAMPVSVAAHQVELAARSNQIDLVAQRWTDLDQQIEQLLYALSTPESNLP